MHVMYTMMYEIYCNNYTADSPGAAAGMKCNIMALFCLIATVVMVMI